MKEIKLIEEDYAEISDKARRKWIDYVPRGNHFVTRCIIKAFLDWSVTKNFIIKNGKIFKEVNNEKN